MEEKGRLGRLCIIHTPVDVYKFSSQIYMGKKGSMRVRKLFIPLVFLTHLSIEGQPTENEISFQLPISKFNIIYLMRILPHQT